MKLFCINKKFISLVEQVDVEKKIRLLSSFYWKVNIIRTPFYLTLWLFFQKKESVIWTEKSAEEESAGQTQGLIDVNVLVALF